MRVSTQQDQCVQPSRKRGEALLHGCVTAVLLAGAAFDPAVLHCPATRRGLLAAVLEAAQPVATSGPGEQVPPGRELAGMALLLVEDNALNQVVASTLLQGAGATVDIVLRLIRHSVHAYGAGCAGNCAITASSAAWALSTAGLALRSAS